MVFKNAKSGRKPDIFLMALLALLILGGLFILASASSELGRIKFGDSYYYLKHQALYGLLPGTIGLIFCFFFPYQNLKKVAFPLFIFNLALLTLVFTKFGLSSGGASRWLEFGPISFQPAELLKLTFIMYISAWVGGQAKRTASFWGGFLPFLVASGIMAGMLFLQPATSTVVILLASAGMVYFLSGAEWKYIFMAAGLVVVILASLIYFTPYRMKRIVGFLDKSSNTQTINYHVNQALIALGSGGAFGMGYGKSTAKVNYLPAVIDDSIFAVVGQEMGFLGTGLITILFGMLVFRLFWLAKKARDKFGRNMLVGFGSIIALQSIVNMGAISGLLPLTGVPLPFISYGGTALAIFMTMGGISLNISKYTG